MNKVFKAYLVSSKNGKFEIGVFSSELGARRAIWDFSHSRVEMNCHNLDDYGLVIPRVLDDYRPTSPYRLPAVRFSLFHGTTQEDQS